MDHGCASQVVSIAIRHPLLMTATHQGRAIIACVDNCVSKVPPQELPSIAREAVKLVTLSKSELDYQVALNLIAKLVKLSTEACEYLTAELFPAGSTVSDPRILEILPVFQKGFDAAGANRMALAVARQVQGQIRRSDGPPLEPGSVGGFGSVTTRSPDGKQVEVFIMSSGNELDAVVAYRHLLAEDTVSELMKAAMHGFRPG
jgi:hypothetical protein